MRIEIDDLSDIRICNFLEEHIEEMKSVTPPESKHALDLDGLKHSDVAFWSAWENEQIIACGAYKKIDASHVEIKSMRVSAKQRGRGVASKLLQHILSEASSNGYLKASLETGAMPFFEPARNLYKKFGFTCCPPFADYSEDPNSVFMTLNLGNGATV